MDSFELNKILGAILGTLLFVMGLGFLAEAIYHPIEGRGPGYALAEAAPVEGAAAGEQAPVQVADLGTLLASADPAAGEAAARKCTGCHNFAEGAGNKQGPELYGVVDRAIGTHPDFAYSAGMLEHKDKGDLWSYANLDAFLTSPKTFTPGTKMSFPGIKDDKERADVLAYLSTLAPTPVPFPAPAAAGEAAPADGSAPAAEAPAAPAAEAPAETSPGVETPTTTDTETSVEGTPAPATTETPAPAAQ
jgi:cytochrome c